MKKAHNDRALFEENLEPWVIYRIAELVFEEPSAIIHATGWDYLQGLTGICN